MAGNEKTEHEMDLAAVDGDTGSTGHPTHHDLPLAAKEAVEEQAATDQTPDDTETKKRKDAKPGLSNFWRLLAYSTTLDRCLMSLAALCSFAAGATLPLMIVVFGRIVANFTGYFVPGSTVTQAHFLSAVDQNSLYIVYLFIAKFVLGYVSIYSFRITGIRISAAVRMAYLTHLFNQPIAAIDKLPAGAATDSLTTAANTIQLAISDKLGLLCQAIALLIAAYIVAFISSWSLTLVSSSCILFIFVVYGAITPAFFKLENAVLESQTSATGVANEVFRAIRTVKSLCAEGAVTERYAGWVAQAKKTGLKKSPVTGLQFAPAYFAIYANMALTFWFGVKLYTWNDIPDVGTIITVLFSVMIVTTSLGMIFAPVQAIYKAASASDLLFRVIDAPTLREGGLKVPDADARADILFQNVHFTYPSRPHSEVIKGLDLHIPSGKVTAFVGPSGCGKSTIVALLERWYELSYVNGEVKVEHEKETTDSKAKDKAKHKNTRTKSEKGQSSERSSNDHDTTQDKPVVDSGPILQNSGRISIGSHSVENLDRKWWRAQIGLVQQEPFLFNETIYDNVAKGLVGSTWEDEPTPRKQELVEEACREAFADEFIRLLPDGYNTLVGEAGIKLSGGQRQRLAIARSIIKKPAILILDEATSAIDVRSEKIVEAALERASQGRTTITIAHRLSTIRKADHIVVLKGGAAVEEGTHAELMAREDGVYNGLVHAQHLEVEGTDEADTDENRLDRAVSKYEHDELQLQNSKSAGSKVDAQDSTQVSADPDKQHGFFASVGRLLHEQRHHRITYAFILLGALGGGASVAISAWLITKVIVVFTYTGEQLISQCNFWSLMLFVLSLGTGVCYALIGYFTNSLSVIVSTTYRQRYFESMLHKPIPWFDQDDRSSGTLSARLSGDPQQLQEILGPNMALPLVAIVNIIGCTILSFVFGWKLSLVVFFSALPVIIGSAFLRVRYELEFEKLNASVFAESSKFAAESISAFRTVASLTLEDTITKRYASLLDDQVRKAFKRGRLSVLVFALSDSLELCCMALAFWYGGQLLGRREYEVQQFFVIYIAIVQGGQAAGQFIAFGPNVAQATAAANRILAIRNEPGIEKSLSTKAEEESNDGMEIEFRNVGFRYPLRETPAYKKLSFNIARGAYIAVVGPSGCGKTTVISLLERFYTPTTGRILIDGTDIAEIAVSQYRTACALVSQEPTLFEGSVKDNLAMGLKNVPSQDSIEEACRAAEIFDFIVSLPQGFDTPLSAGTHTSLSGGQKQRLCIARALLRKPRLLLLDEATSSLDSQSERLVQKAIEKVAAGKKVTIVVVAHRLATVQNADRIIVLGDGGKILEEGSHGELLRRRGAYWSMCQAQALDR